MSDDLALVTVIYNNYDVLRDFFISLGKQTNQKFNLFISDLSDIKKEIVPVPPNTVFLMEENRGYAFGVNMGLRKAMQNGMTKFCIVNSDTILSNDFVENIRFRLTNFPRSIIGGKIYYSPGYEFHKRRYKKEDEGKVIWYAGGFIDWNHALSYHRGVDEVDKGRYDVFGETEFITGCCMCFDKKVIGEIEYWDERYFLYYEDADYCERAKRKNIHLYYDPKIILWHKNAQSTGGSGSNIHTKYQKKNQFLFGLKYAPFKTKLHLLKNYFLR